MDFIRNKRIIVALILVLALAGGGFWIFSKTSEKNARPEGKISVENDVSAKEAPDSDDDGLKDWEEELWGTDPANQDTDGDGATDSEEINANRDPKKAGPDDALAQKIKSEVEEKIAAAEISGESASLTEKIAEDVFAAYTEKRSQGLGAEGLTGEIPNFIADNLANAEVLEDKFSSKDVKISKTSDAAAIKSYINSIAKLSREAGAKIKENELITLTNSINKSNSSDNFEKFAEFEKISLAYKDIVSKMLLLETPADYAAIHVSHLNSFNNLAEINLIFSQFMGDPASGLLAVNQYIKETERITSSLSAMGRRLDKDNISFGLEEEGFALISLITRL